MSEKAQQISVLIADDEQNCRIHLTRLLSEYPELRIDAKAETGTQVLGLLEQRTFDLAFLDIDIPELTGIEATKKVAQTGKKLPYIIFVTAFSNHAATAFDLGAVDYLVKPVSAFRLSQAMEKFRAIRSSSRNAAASSLVANFQLKYQLTSREAEICDLIGQGLFREDIQDKLSFSPATMKSHLASIYGKCGLGNEDSGRGDKFSRLLFLLFKNS